MKNRAGMFAAAGAAAIAAAAKTILRVAPNNSGISIVNPAKTPAARLSDLHLHLRDPPDADTQGSELKTVRPLGADEGQTSGPKLLFSPLPKVVLKASVKTLNLVHS